MPTSELVNDSSHVLKKHNFLHFLSLGYDISTPPGLLKVSGLVSGGRALWCRGIRSRPPSGSLRATQDGAKEVWNF